MELDKERLDGMKCGSFNNSSYWGFKSSVLKSGVCKYFRRKVFDKFEWCVVEMMLFGIKNKGILTNILNRLRILLMEELVFDSVGDIANCVDLIENMDGLSLEEKIGRMLEFCSIVKELKRARVVSYINNWWRNKKNNFDISEVVVEKVKKYEKKGDSEELLKLGELFIMYMENYDERVFGVLMRMYKMEEKYGMRYRRKEGVYLLFEICEDLFVKDERFKKVFKFGMNMFFRKGMGERLAFGVWLVSMVWKRDAVDFSSRVEGRKYSVEEVIEYMRNRESIVIDEDFVVNDYHVNKKFGLGKFGEVGSKVIDEDVSILGSNGEKYRRFYVDCKKGIKWKRLVKKYKVDVVVDESKLEVIDWSKFSNIEVLEDGVCGLKVCCIKVEYEGKKYIIKEMKESFRYGRDYMVVDLLKKEFNIRDLGMKRIKSNVGLEVVDSSKKSFVGNWKWGNRDIVYCMMDEFVNIGDLGKNKGFLENDGVFKESMKIRLFDGLFRSSDNILRNILVNEEGDVISIDEGDIYGKRKLIFNKTDWFLKKENIEKSKKVISEILEEWSVESKIDIVEDKMKLFGFDSMIIEMKDRFSRYNEIVMSEFN
tara:strand:- start:7926 stop:9710 length:1785 start_codon:yes stop_codon:yes gene_type:complete